MLTFVFQLNVTNNFLILFLSCQPEEVATKFCKNLEGGPLLRVIFVVLSNLDGRVDDFHDKRSIVFGLLQLKHLSVLPLIILLNLNVDVVADLDAARVDEIILSIVDSVDLGYHLSQSRSSAGRWRLRVHVCQIDENVLENVVHLDHQTLLNCLDVDLVFKRTGFERLDCVAED
jgi:hypothetical protein